MKTSFVLLALFLTLDPAMAAETLKKTVCSMTINSDDEIETFKNILPASEFNFIELVDLVPIEQRTSRDVAKHMCRSEIKCDILLISAEFA